MHTGRHALRAQNSDDLTQKVMHDKLDGRWSGQSEQDDGLRVERVWIRLQQQWPVGKQHGVLLPARPLRRHREVAIRACTSPRPRLPSSSKSYSSSSAPAGDVPRMSTRAKTSERSRRPSWLMSPFQCSSSDTTWVVVNVSSTPATDLTTALDRRRVDGRRQRGVSVEAEHPQQTAAIGAMAIRPRQGYTHLDRSFDCIGHHEWLPCQAQETGLRQIETP